MLLVALFLVATAVARPMSGVYGADVSAYVSSSSWSCLRTAHAVRFVVVRGFRSLGSVDPNAAQTLANAATAAIAERHVYFFPSFFHMTANASVDAFHRAAQSWTSFQRVWIDVEGGTQYWSSDCQTNIDYIESITDRLHAWGYHVGVYTSASQWAEIACSRSTSLANLPLWYPHYDNNPT